MKSKESKGHSGKEIEFDAKLLLKSLRDHGDHLEGKKKLTLRESRVVLAMPLKAITPKQKAAIRRRLNVSRRLRPSKLQPMP